MIRFERTPDKDNSHDIATVIVHSDKQELTVSEAVDLFEQFLMACGYSIKMGQIEFRGEDEN